MVGNGGIVGIGGTALDMRLSEGDVGVLGSKTWVDPATGGDLGPEG